MTRSAFILCCCLLALLVWGLSTRPERPAPIRIVAVQAHNPGARRETMAELRSAWRTRQVLKDDRGKRAELRFLVSLASAVRRFKDTESYVDICRLWNECLRDHLARFPESA